MQSSPSDIHLLRILLAIAAMAVLAIVVDARARGEIVRARQAFREREHKEPPEHAVGCVRCHLELADDPERHPQIGLHRERADLSCERCHGGDPSALTYDAAGHGSNARGDEKIVTGAAAQARCMECHTRSYALGDAPIVTRGEVTYVERGCAGCHATSLSPELRRTAPSFAQMAGKVTREWTYRYLIDPASFDATAGPGTHHLSGDSVALTAKAMRLADFVAAVPGPAKTPMVNGGGRDVKAIDEMCHACHSNGGGACSLAAIGTKTNATWLKAFLREPRAHAYALHPDMLQSPGEAQRMAEHLAGQHHLTFEPSWPTASRVLDRELDALPPPLALAEKEGCTFCHGERERVPFAAPEAVERTLRRPHYGAWVRNEEERAALTAFADATAIATRSRASVAPHNGRYWFKALACATCHDAQRLAALDPPAIAVALARPPHDYGFRDVDDDSIVAAISEHVASTRAPVRVEPVDAAPNLATIERGAAACKKVRCEQCFELSRVGRFREEPLRAQVLACFTKQKAKVVPEDVAAIAAYLSALAPSTR